MFFATWIGSDLARPTNISWLLMGDWAQHYSAWEMYRVAPWGSPPGAIPTLFYPLGTAIIYTDSLPFFAFLFKPFAHWLPTSFQYIGLWMLCSCVLQGAFSALLVRIYCPSSLGVLYGCLLFLMAPIFLARFGHDTLTAQWLILAGLWLYFRHDLPISWRREVLPWWVLASISALVHPYLAAMCFVISAAYWTRRAIVDRERSKRQALLATAGAVVLTLVAWWASGAFVIGYRDGSGGIPYGKYSFNLLGFLNPLGFSNILPTLPMVDGAQWEGFAYLGLGVLTLIVILGLEIAVRRQQHIWPTRHWPLMVAAVSLAIFAASSVLTIGPWKVTDLALTSPVLATFRSSGRFIWLLYYLILLAAMVTTLRRLPVLATSILALVAISEFWEFSNMHLHYAKLRTGIDWPAPENLLLDPKWAELAAGRSHLTMLPPAACGVQAGPYLPFQIFAARHSMTFNSGYLARWDLRGTVDYCARLANEIDARGPKADDLYVVGETWAARLGDAMNCYLLDGYRACVLPR